MKVETKFLRLGQPVSLGLEIDGWRVCWLGGWGKHRLFYFVMVMRLNDELSQLGADEPANPTVTPRGHSGRRSSDPVVTSRMKTTARRSTGANAQR
jgi:hypothetical protein